MPSDVPACSELLSRVARAFEDSARLHPVESWILRVDAHRVRVRCCHPELGIALRRAMGHLESEDETQAELDLWIFEETETHPIRWRERTREIWVRGDVRHDWGADLELSANLSSGFVQLLHARSRTAAAWLPSGGRLEAWEDAAPLRNLWSLWARHTSPRAVLLHAAAIAFSGQALILTGPGGSGKSTTSLAAARSGAQFLGDDFVWCATSTREGTSPLQVSSLYRTAKLLSGPLTETLLPPPRGAPLGSSGHDGEKTVLCLHDPARLERTAPVVAWVVPRIRDSHSGPRLTPLSRVELLQALLPSSLFLVSGDTRERHDLLRALASSLPGYELSLSPSHAENVTALERLSRDLAPPPFVCARS